MCRTIPGNVAVYRSIDADSNYYACADAHDKESRDPLEQMLRLTDMSIEDIKRGM